MLITLPVFRMMECRVLLLGISILLGTTTEAHPWYQTYIPNGDKVPNPCLAGTAWSGVGHLIPGGTGERNPFGRDFAAGQYVSIVWDDSVSFVSEWMNECLTVRCILKAQLDHVKNRNEFRCENDYGNRDENSPSSCTTIMCYVLQWTMVIDHWFAR